MPRYEAFAIAIVVALALAWLMALQMMLSFRTMDEFSLVALAIAVQVLVSAGALVMVLRLGLGERGLALAVLGLALATLAFSGLPRWMDAVDAVATSPFPSANRDAQIVLEFLIPGVAALIVLWRILVRARRQAAGLDSRTIWPWFSIAAGLALVFNPVGLEIAASALIRSPTDWLSGLSVAIVAGAAAVVVVFGVIEIALRARRSRLPEQAEV